MVLTGAGAAALAGGAATGVLAVSESRRGSAALARGDFGTWAGAQTSSRRLGWTAAAVGGAGAAVVVAGAWLWLGDRRARVSVAVDPSTVHLAWEF
jgi:hypothetical protein